MKKLLSLLMVALLLPLTSGAVDLEPNQRLMGHYTTDDLATSGWGNTSFEGLCTVATDITADELAAFGNGEIVAFRVGLCLSTPISRVFVIPVMPNGNVLMDQTTEWPCEASAQGWNMIQLATPYQLRDLPAGYSLRIGFDYMQETKFAKPLSVLRVGTTYPSYHYVDGIWKQVILSSKGNLSLQCVVQNDNFPKYVIRVRNVEHKSMIKVGNDLNVSFETYNLGSTDIGPGNCTYNIAVDGVLVNTLTNPVALTSAPITMNFDLNTEELEVGGHTLTITPATVNGETLDPVVFTSTFAIFEHGFDRQMHLVEQFTSTGCTWCPVGTANVVDLINMRDDVAWVAVHVLFGSPIDPFSTNQSEAIATYQGINSYPTGTFDRTTGISAANQLYGVLSGLSASTMSSFFDYVENQSPSWATVFINSTFDADSRQAVVTINGDLVPGFEAIMGEDAKLNVYLTEDGLVAPQINQGNLENNYVHNNVLRQALGSTIGVGLNKTSDVTYKNTFTVDIPADWNTDKMHIVAFISRPLGNPLNDIFITNTNMRTFGESDAPEVTPGDVDGDGKINIDDVTTLIRMLLSGESTTPGADVNSDGKINIDDVTTLIDKLLRGI